MVYQTLRTDVEATVSRIRLARGVWFVEYVEEFKV